MTRLYAWIAALLAAVATAVAFWLGGRKSKQLDIVQDNLKAATKAKDTRHELESQDDQHIINILSGKLRDKR